MQETNNPVKFLLNLRQGPSSEPEIDSQSFLHSYASVGAWIRVVSADLILRNLNPSKSTPLERAAHVAGFYQLLGAQAEDLGVILIALSIWRHDRSRSLPALMARIFLKQGAARNNPAEGYIDQVADAFAGPKKSFAVDAQAYFASAGAKTDRDLVDLFLGYPWKKNPWARLVLKAEREMWDVIPRALRKVCYGYAAQEGPLLTVAYNKIKHGPQMIVQDARVVAEVDRSHTGNELDEIPRWLGPAPHVRLLFQGARTQEGDDELQSGGRVAPFLIGATDQLNKMFFESMVHYANLMSVLAVWHLRLCTGESVRIEFDDAAKRISTAHQGWLHSRYG